MGPNGSRLLPKRAPGQAQRSSESKHAGRVSCSCPQAGTDPRDPAHPGTPGAVGCFCIEGDILRLAGLSQVVCRCSRRVRACTQVRSLQRTPFHPRVFKFSVEDKAGLSQWRKLSVPCKMTRSLMHSDHFRVCKAESARLRLQCHVGKHPSAPAAWKAGSS